MRKIIAIILLISCNTHKIVVGDLNTIGVVTSIKECNCELGKFKYSVELNPHNSIEYHSNNSYKIGDSIYFKTNISNE